MIASLGIDVGGTSVKIGLVDKKGRILARRHLVIDHDISHADLARGISEACRAIASPEYDIRGLGVATPGYMDPATGILRDGGENLPCLRHASLPRALSADLNLPVEFENDGLAAILGELHFGAAQGARNAALLTLGSGVGGGIVLGGQPVRGARGEPPELGAIVLDAMGAVNYSGLAGTLEYYAGKAGFLRAFADNGLPGDDLIALFAAVPGDPAAERAVDQVAAKLAQACGSLINALNLDLILLGGGISSAGEALMSSVRRQLAHYTWPMLLERSELRLAARRNDAGLLGAASFFLFPDNSKVMR